MTPSTAPRGRADWARGAGLLLGVALDAAVGDPRRWHPVAGFGRAAAAAERLVWSDSRWRGGAFTVACVGSTIAAGVWFQRSARRSPVLRAGTTALATWAVIGSRSLAAEALSVNRRLEAGDLPGARERISHLVGRDPSSLSSGEIARAAVESVAENTSDAVVAPLVWGAVAGIPGLVGYRAVNTLDAMVGHRSARYARFGWASARLDDLANLLPARATAVCVAALSDDPRDTWRLTRRDARRHPSPNSGWCEASWAAALGLRLGGTNVYGGRTEHRPTMGDGRAPASVDVPRAVRLEQHVTLVAAVAAALTATAAPIAMSLVTRILGRRRRPYRAVQ